eukprot:14030129-Alexandrium_andersonii.AAC.1
MAFPTARHLQKLGAPHNADPSPARSAAPPAPASGEWGSPIFCRFRAAMRAVWPVGASWDRELPGWMLGRRDPILARGLSDGIGAGAYE